MKKILSLVLALMLMAAVAVAEPSPTIQDLVGQEAPVVEGAVFTPVPVDVTAFAEQLKADPVQVLGAVAADKVAGLPVVAVNQGTLQILPGAETVKMTSKAPVGLKDGDKVVVVIAIPGWPGDAIQAEVINGEVVFILDEAMLIALQNIPGFNGDLLFAFFKGELPVVAA